MGTLINIAQQGKNLFYRSKQVIYASLLIAAVSACGGGGGSSAGSDSGGGQTIGTRFTGKAATGSSLANADIRIKSASGRAVNTQTNNNGDFSSSELTEPTTNTADRAYLLSMQQNDGSFLYSVAHQQNATFVDNDSQSVTINIHPFTDLMVRNWFAQQYPGQDIDTLMASNQAINLPSADEITQISNEF